MNIKRCGIFANNSPPDTKIKKTFRTVKSDLKSFNYHVQFAYKIEKKSSGINRNY